MLAITDRAAVELQKTLGPLPEPRPRVRVFIDHRCRCGTVHFAMRLDDRVRAGDTAFEVSGVAFVADDGTVPELPAAEIDYQDEFMRRGFAIRNVNHDCGGGQHAG